MAKLYFKDDPVWNQTVYNQEAQAFEPAYVFVRRDQALEEFAKKAGITPYQGVPAGGMAARMGPRAVQVKTPEYEKFIQDFESKGFQIASDDPAGNDVINTYLIDPQGNKQILYTDVKDNKRRGFFGDFFYGLGGLAKELAPAALASLGAYGLTAGVGSLLAGGAAGAGAGAGAAGAAGAGIAEGMAPGVLAAASPAELAAVNALVSPAAATNALTSGAPPSFRPSENYGPGMTGAQTSAYDTVVNATGSPTLASAAAGGAELLENVGGLTGLTNLANLARSGNNDGVWGPLISSLASLYGGSQAAEAAGEAANITGAAANRAIDLQQRMYEEGVARQQPFYQAGVNALAQLQQRTGAMPPAFTGQVDLTRDPGYAFRLSEGLKGLERSAAARGGLMSGATGKALTRFGQEAASQEYQNAYNRALTEYNALRQRESEEYNRLSGLAGTGGTTAQQIGVAGQQMASNVGNIGMQQGSTAANALLSGAAARQSAYGDVGKAWGQYFAPQPVINYLGGRPYGG